MYLKIDHSLGACVITGFTHKQNSWTHVRVWPVTISKHFIHVFPNQKKEKLELSRAHTPHALYDTYMYIAKHTCSYVFTLVSSL